MATSVLFADRPEKILIVWPKPNIEIIRFSFNASFTCLLSLIQYVCKSIKTVDAFLLIIPRAELRNLLHDPVYQFGQVKDIYVYYDDNILFEQEKAYLEAMHPKLRLCYERDLTKELDRPMIDNAVHPSRSIDRTAITSFASSVTQRVSAKKPPATSSEQRFDSASLRGFTVKNMELIDDRFLCSVCKLVIREPWQLDCGHRTCHSCIYIENDQMNCSTCFESSSSNKIWLDKGFRREMEKLLISCAICDWTETLKGYEEHMEQDHQERVHQDVLSNSPPSLHSTYMLSNDNQRQNPLIEIHIRIIDLSNNLNKLNNDQQRINNEMCSNQNALQIVSKELPSLRSSFEDHVNLRNGMMINNDILHQEIWRLKQNIEDRLFTSFDGTLLWKITNVEEKIAKAQSGRQLSIFSPPFYSSPAGYKMCLRLYLNGDSDVQGRYLSLFFVIMRGKHDAILQWPFPYKVTFSLIDQSNQHNISNCIWPDMTLSCFQRPIRYMNEDYGIKEFFPLGLLRRDRRLYIKDNIMFIKCEISFAAERPGTSGTGATSNSEYHSDVTDQDITNALSYSDTL